MIITNNTINDIPVEKNVPTDVHLVPKNYKNDTFVDNLNYFKKNNKALYQAMLQHRCSEYHLAKNDDESFNVVHLASSSLYYPRTQQEMDDSIQHQVDHPQPLFTINPALLLSQKTQDWLAKNPILGDLYKKLYALGPLKKMGDEFSAKNYMDGFTTDYISFLRVYGVGLGYHIDKILRQKNVSTLVIYEPKIDLFYCSLFTIPWFQLLGLLEQDDTRYYKLMVGITAQEAVQQEQEFIHGLHPFLTTFSTRLQHRPSPQVKQLRQLQTTSDQVALIKSSGWYEDQRAGLINNLRNIKQQRAFYTGKKLTGSSRVFIVGSGPSLNESMAYIKKHQHQAIIFAAGSGITPLLKNGIIPDYHILQERTWTVKRVLDLADKEDLKKITAIKINALIPELDELYAESYLVQKSNDPGSCLLMSEQFPHLDYINPTVTNTATAIAAILDFKEIYLYGVDYGVAENAQRMHAENTIYDKEKQHEAVDNDSLYRLAGNFSSSIISNRQLSWSHDMTSRCVAQFSHIKWFNVGEGAAIAGAKALTVKKIDKTLKKTVDKSKVKTQLKRCFSSNYDAQEVAQRLTTEQFSQCSDYVNIALDFMFLPVTSRLEINNVLINLYRAVNEGFYTPDYLPNKLFAGEFMRFIEDLYVQVSCSLSEDEGIALFQQAGDVVQTHFKHIFADLQQRVNDCLAEE